MRKLFNYLCYVALCSTILTVTSCGDDDMDDFRPAPGDLEYSFGWIGEDNMNEVPTSTNFGFGNTSNLPSSVDLVPKFPPIGDQGNFGTCVAWSVAYNAKTAANGMRKGLNTSQLTTTNNQFSPKDMFTALPDNKKGADCNGTNFTEALSLMQNRGVATMQTVPYSSLGNCSQTNVQSNWTSEASQNKIKYWRRIDPTVNSIKQNLANNIPVILGAKLADNFMTWNSDEVINSGTTTNQVGQHAYHALVIAGYDDNKGPNGAFRVINSWGGNWGDQGYIWIDYSYLINEFCVSFNGGKPLFIMEDGDGDGNVTPPDQNPTPNATGVDVAPWAFNDYSTFGSSGFINERVIDFNIYNIGNQTASANDNWSIYYIYFNAYNANDYDVIFYDDFNTSVAQNTYQCPTDYNCIFNLDIPAGNDFANAAFGTQSVERTYYMPQITGQYYLAMIADAEDKYQETDELNNIFYTTLDPVFFQDGYAARTANDSKVFEFKNELSPSRSNLKSNPYQTIVNEQNRNAYTKEEIMAFIKNEKQSGRLQQKINQHIAKKGAAPYKN